MSTLFKIDREFKNSLTQKYGKVFCELKVSSYIPITPDLLFTKNYNVEYLDSVEISGSFVHLEGIFKHKSNIYLYLSKANTMEATFQLKVYYEIENLDEVEFLIKNLIKMK
jgi:hypothetical protein